MNASNGLWRPVAVRALRLAWVSAFALPWTAAQAQTELQKLLATPGAAGELFGNAISISGDIAVVGAYGADGGAGAAYVFRKIGSEWVQEQRLSHPDPDDFFFGADVAACSSPSGEVVAVGTPWATGAPQAAFFPGAVYVYRRSAGAWQPEQKIFATNPGPDLDFFGFAVAAVQDRIVVGSPGFDGFRGAVYVYRFNGAPCATPWCEEATALQPNDIVGTQQLGERVGAYAMADTALFAASAKDVGGNAAYVYRYTVGGGWQIDPGPGGGKLFVAESAPGDGFGWTAIHGDVAVVGAPGRDLDLPPRPNAGAAYVFRYNGLSWDFEERLTAADAEAHDLFGATQSVFGDLILVGAHFDDAETGGVYPFRFDGTSWVPGPKLLRTDPAAGDQFATVALFGSTAFVGAWLDDDDARGTDAGSAYVYQLFNSPAGSNVSVQPVDSDGGGSPATLTFENIESSGNTTIDVIGSGPPPDPGFQVGEPPTYYEIATTALFSGLVTVCVAYNPADFDPESPVLLHHYEGGSWVNVTIPPLPSTPPNVVCGKVAFFSPFLVVQAPGDTDQDGLSDAEEALLGTNPLVPDTDGDGLLDGTEVDIADGSGCPNPLVADSDGDGLADGHEVLTVHSNPCNPDSDGDAIPDSIDPFPLDPGGTQGYLEAQLRNLSTIVGGLDPALFTGPNLNANAGRRTALSNRASAAANEAAAGNYDAAINVLATLLDRVDGFEPPEDWIAPGLERDVIAQSAANLLVLLGYL